MHLFSGIKGGTEVQTIQPANADGDLLIRSCGRSRVGKDVHGARVEDDVEAVQVPEGCHYRPDSSCGQELGGRGLVRGREGGWFVEAAVTRPAYAAAESSSAAGYDATAQRMEATERAA